MALEINGMGQAYICGGVKQDNGNPHVLITGSPTSIHIETNDRKTCTDSLPLKVRFLKHFKLTYFNWKGFLCESIVC
jgi:hypothetical protein